MVCRGEEAKGKQPVQRSWGRNEHGMFQKSRAPIWLELRAIPGRRGLTRLKQQQNFPGQQRIGPAKDRAWADWGAREKLQQRKSSLLFNLAMAIFLPAISLLKDHKHQDLLFLSRIHATVTSYIRTATWMITAFSHPLSLRMLTATSSGRCFEPCFANEVIKPRGN